jgi:hypothetical protein
LGVTLRVIGTAVAVVWVVGTGVVVLSVGLGVNVLTGKVEVAESGVSVVVTVVVAVIGTEVSMVLTVAVIGGEVKADVVATINAAVVVIGTDATNPEVAVAEGVGDRVGTVLKVFVGTGGAGRVVAVAIGLLPVTD